jgi:hypothetical protein
LDVRDFGLMKTMASSKLNIIPKSQSLLPKV